MKRLFQTVLTVIASRAVLPSIVGLFFLLYIVIAFFTDETLIALLSLTGKSSILAGILALIPISVFFRIVLETVRYCEIRRVLAGKMSEDITGLFDESVELSTTLPLSDLQSRIAAVGYTTRCTESTLSACRGANMFPVRVLFLAAIFCLFTGILVSVTTKTAQRQMVIEGEPLFTPKGQGGMVERIILENGTGSILSKTLTMVVAPSSTGYGKRTFGLYPPSLYGGSFVYPRYLGLALHLRFFAPDLQAGYETQCFLKSFPPGKEDGVAIPGSAYRIIFSLPDPPAGVDRYISYMSGDITLKFKLLKGKEVIFTGSMPRSGEFVRDGFRLEFPDIRRLVVTDFVRDYGVLFIWGAGLFFAAAVCFWLPIRVFFPRRELLFRSELGVTHAYSRAEGGRRNHAGVFHEALDLADASNHDTTAT